jgi:hypothetical protein
MSTARPRGRQIPDVLIRKNSPAITNPFTREAVHRFRFHDRSEDLHVRRRIQSRDHRGELVEGSARLVQPSGSGP